MISRRSFITGAAVAGLIALSGCAGGASSQTGSGASGSGSGSGAGAGSGASGASGASASASGASAASQTSAQRIAVGTLATEDILPYWVAQDEGLFAREELDVEVVQFQSATELIAGVGSGDVDLAMTDIMVTASMFASGIDLQMEWVTLGTEPGQGRFGIMVGPNSETQTLEELAGVPIGVGTNTILEYVMDQLMEEAGVPDNQIVVEELQKLPVRYQAMLTGDVQAAALPGSLLALGEANGCRTIADDTSGKNISQSVMIARNAFLERAGNSVLDKLKAVWDEAAQKINADPEAYRLILVANANLSDEVASSYPISTYPTCQLPTKEMVDPVLAWMDGKGYLTRKLTYDETTGALALA